jgi:hypothetical protein
MIFSMSAFELSAQLQNYSTRLKAHVNASEVYGASDLTNFPVLVELSHPNLRLLSDGGFVTNSNGYDILLTESDGITTLSHQIENYSSNTTLGTITFWVRFPTLSTSIDTEFYIYFGNNLVSTNPSTTSVWDPNYKMVLHLNEEQPADTYPDAAGEGTDALNNGTILSTGKIGGGITFVDANNRVRVEDNGISPLDISGNISISLWVNIANLDFGPDIFTKGNYTNGYALWVDGFGRLRFQVNFTSVVSPPNQLSNGTWTYVTITRASNSDATNDIKIYSNGALIASDINDQSFEIDNEDFFLGTSNFWPFLGLMDEFRISNIVRDSSWIATEYSNQNDPSQFLDFINTEPILSDIETSNLTFNSGDIPLIVTSNIAIFDGDDPNFESAVIEISDNYEPNEDILEFIDQLGITGSWDSSNGVLTLTGKASLSDYQSALRSVTYINSNLAPTENTRTITFSVFDGDIFSNTQARSVEIIKINTPPILSDIEEAPLIYFPSFDQVQITNNINISDLDFDDIQNATIEISSGLVAGEDQLNFSDKNDISGSWDDDNGILTLSGEATITKYIDALRSVTYENLNSTPTNSDRILSITINDGAENSNTVTRKIEHPQSISDMAIYKPNDVFHFDAQDADGDGIRDANQPDDGQLLIWGDRSDNVGGTSPDLSANSIGTQAPVLNSSLIGGRTGIAFDGTNNNVLNPPNDGLINLDSFTEKSFFLVFRTTEDVTSLQIIYEQGAGTRGYQFSIKDSVLYAFTWNRQEWSIDNQNKSINLGPVDSNTTYTIIASHDASASDLEDKIWRASVNGGPILTLNNVDFQRPHAGRAEIGNITQGSRDPVTFRGTPQIVDFEGTVAELSSWNSALTDSDFSNLYAYSKNKWENIKPVLSGIEVTDLPFLEGNSASIITSSLTIANDDSIAYDRSIDSAKVVILTGYESSEDILALENPVSGITANFDPSNGTLTLTGNESLTNYQLALQSVTYQNTNVIKPSETIRTVEFTVFDWDDQSNTVRRRIQILQNNSPPSLNAIEPTILSFSENDNPINITASLLVSDIDHSNLEGASISLSNNYMLGEDELQFDNQNGIIGTFNSSTGILTLSGTSTVTNYQNALRSVTFNNTSLDPVTSLNREISFRVFDGVDSSDVQSRELTITSFNTTPTLSDIETTNLFYQVGDTTIITESITIVDPDNPTIESASIEINSGFDSAEDSLLFESVFGITGNWDDLGGILTLTGPAPKIDFESALRTVKYLNTANTPTDSERTIVFSVNDGVESSNASSRTVSFSIPKSITGLLLWLKGDAGVEEAASDPAENGDNVLNWLDQSGNNNDFTSNGAIAPIYQGSISSLNSKPAIEFSGTSLDEKLEDEDAETQYLGGLAGLTIFFVIESDVTSTDKGFWTTTRPNSNSGDRYFSLRYDADGQFGNATNVITSGLRDLTAFSLESFEEAQTTNGQIVMLKWTSETTYEMYIDGVLSNPTSTTSIPSGILSPSNLTTAIIGQGPRENNTNTNESSWDGLIAEVILYDNGISITDQERIENYLANKYNLPIRLLSPALGGDAISADDASSSAIYTTLSGPRIQESFAGELSSGTFIFEAPDGYEWDDTGSNPTARVNAAFGGSSDLLVSFTSRTKTQITFTITSSSTDNPAEITFENLRVRPTSGIIPNVGTIKNVGSTGLGGATDYGLLNLVPGNPANQIFLNQPNSSTLNLPINPSPRLQLIDQFGNPINKSRISVSVSLNQISGSGNFNGSSITTVETNFLGVADFTNLSIDDVGTYSLTFSSAGLTDTTSNQFDVVLPGELTNFLIQRAPSGNISDKLAGQDFNISLIAVDGTQNTATSFNGTVSLTSNCTIGTGIGTSPSFTDGVLPSLTMSISNIGSCTLTATNTSGTEQGTSNAFTVTTGAASETTSIISANPSMIFNDGFSTTTVTVQAIDSEGNPVLVGGNNFELNVTSGSLSPLIDNNDGTYTSILTSSINAGIATITGTLDGAALANNATVEYAEFNALWQSQFGAVADASNWYDPNNWSAGVVPSNTDKVYIPASPSVGNEQPVINENSTTIQQLVIEDLASVTLSGGTNLTVNDAATGDGEILGSNADSLSVGGYLNVNTILIGYVILDGEVTQLVETPNTFSNLIIDNSDGINMIGDLTVLDSLKLLDGDLFIPNGSNLIANSKSYELGSIRMQRVFIGKKGFRLISSPLSTTYGDLLDGIITQGYPGAFYSDTTKFFPNVFTYTESIQGTRNDKFQEPDSASSNVNQGQGIWLFVFEDNENDDRYNIPLPDTLDTSGREWEGDGNIVDFGITYTEGNDEDLIGWNHIGNPFAATIDWDDNQHWTKTNVEASIYVWDPAANFNDGEFLVWNGFAGTLPNGLIAPFQGFVVRANGENPVLSVHKEAKTQNGTFLRKNGSNQEDNDLFTTTTNSVYDFVQIGIGVKAENGRSKSTNITFTDQASEMKDSFDAYTLTSRGSNFIEFNTLLQDGTPLDINNLPLTFNSRYSIPLYFNNSFDDDLNNSYQIIWDDLRSVPEDWIVTLKDNATGVTTNVLEENEYTFTQSSSSSKRQKVNPFDASFYMLEKKKSLNTRFELIISTEEIETNVPVQPFLSQNYPNPFNPKTTINFGLNQKSEVILEIFDILGRRIQTLINENREPGRYQTTFDANALASGVYFYRLQTNETVFIKQMTLIK